jgi:hypothetical protein
MVKLSRQSRLAINNQNTVYKKSALLEAGGWIPDLHWFSDWFADCAVGFRYGMCHVPEVLSHFYLAPGSYYNAKAGAHKERRVVMERMLEYLESDRFADVRPFVRDSGFMGLFGWPMMKLVLMPEAWRFAAPPFVRQAEKRSAEIIGRRFSGWLVLLTRLLRRK